MEFMGQYLQLLRKRDPSLYKDLSKRGQLIEYSRQKSTEAHKMLDDLMAPEPKGPDGLPRDLNGMRMAEERVRAEMFDFPVSEHDQHLEPPDDLMQGPKGRTAKLR